MRDKLGRYIKGRRRSLNSRLKQGSSIKGECHWNWKGGRLIDKKGYVSLYKPSHPQSDKHGYIREHRLVMEQKLGRYLTKEEDVHHVNGIKSDNRIENLELMSHGEHSRRTHLGRRSPLIGRKRPELAKKLKGQHHSPATEFKKGSPPPPHKKECKCFRCIRRSPNPLSKQNQL